MARLGTRHRPHPSVRPEFACVRHGSSISASLSSKRQRTGHAGWGRAMTRAEGAGRPMHPPAPPRALVGSPALARASTFESRPPHALARSATERARCTSALVCPPVPRACMPAATLASHRHSWCLPPPASRHRSWSAPPRSSPSDRGCRHPHPMLSGLPSLYWSSSPSWCAGARGLAEPPWQGL
jgi:hypothetical protein